ncbi:MAG: hypothetical protein GTO03_18545, partial [Planctomycetales bacterium]|nr:hypothetical protein [Planctomycetales bacterium]
LGIGAVLGTVIVVILLRLFTGWFFALPLVLFEDTTPGQALRTSRQRAAGHRGTLLLWLVVWGGVSSLLSLLATAGLIGL